MHERNPRFTSLSGLDINRVYSRDDLKDWSPESDLGAPGEFPFTRGVYPTIRRHEFVRRQDFGERPLTSSRPELVEGSRAV